MKSFAMMLAAVALSFPLAALAQTDTTLTRAQVRADLQQLEQAGYEPFKGEDPSYPTDIQAAEARVAARNGETAYGGMPSGSTASGSRVIARPASPEELKQLYFGGQ
jgi:Domain of unknown function (DUF4148)